MRRVGLVLALAGLAVLLAVPLASADPWLQPRGDAAATGYQPGAGPERPDVALIAQLPGDAQPVDDPPPLILEDRVIVMGFPRFDDRDGDMRAYSVDLATGAVEVVAKVPYAQPMRMATDGETLYLSGDGAVHARPLEPGGSYWNWTWSRNVTEEGLRVTVTELETCRRMALQGENVTVLCRLTDFGVVADVGGPKGYSNDAQRADVLAARLDATSGSPQWVWRPRAPSENGTEGLENENKEPPFDEDPLGLAVAGNRVIVETLDNQEGCVEPGNNFGCQGPLRVTVRALNVEDGLPEWDQPWRSPPVNRMSVAGENPDSAGAGTNLHQAFPNWGNPAASGAAVYVKVGSVYKLNIGNGDVLWDYPVGEGDVDRQRGDFATALALSPGDVYATTAQTVHRLGKDNPRSGWKTGLNFSASEGFQEDPIVTPEAVYAAGESEGGGQSVYRFDRATGDTAWRHRVLTDLWAFSVGEGLVAYTNLRSGDDWAKTKVVILGETEASLGPFDVSSERYAAPGERVVLDLSGTGPGAFGPPTRYKVDWGDGNATSWQEDPVFRHAYEGSRDRTVHVRVGNDANQTASTTFTVHVGEDPPSQEARFAPEGSVSLDASKLAFGDLDEPERYRVFWGDGNVSDWQENPVFTHEYAEDGNVTARVQAADADNDTASQYLTMRVGQSPPPEPNLAQKAFAKENQDMTFGILGLVVAATGGAIGVTRRYRKRSRLQDELDAIERAYEETKDSPIECEAQLTERKTHARGLMLDGELDEGQFQVVENRINELLQGLRKRSLEEEFDFLPYSLVKKGREMLEDGAVSALEAEAFLQAVEEDEVLSAEQKAVVRERIEEWRGRDAGGGGTA